MWRKAHWKLILFLPGRLTDAVNQNSLAKGELYYLTEDPHEWTNLYSDEKHAAVREQMKTELLTHLACTWARGPILPEQQRVPAVQKTKPDK